ncbi:hypothetical protein [Burkholderia sp. S171]|jgi:hypothetical protein|uniref:hypothetical protein n=1 Tax=Burkholderia sp. S171 TaxID=1641860 RepID=UPI00131C7B9F|nr:hypothetical protein [Burkholderia sp. S171]
MKHRTFYAVAAAAVLTCTAGCTTAYRNGQECKAKMVETYPATLPKLTYEIPRVAYQSTRVVVEGSYTKKIPPAGVTLIKPTTTTVEAAVECTFEGDKLKTFQWLTPATLAEKYPLTPPAAADTE